MTKNDRKILREQRKALKAILIKSTPLKTLAVRTIVPFGLSIVILICTLNPYVGYATFIFGLITAVIDGIPNIKEIIHRKRNKDHDKGNRA